MRVYTRHQDRDLGRVEHAVVVRNVFVVEAMPFLALLQRPAARVLRQQIIRGLLKEENISRNRIGHLIRLEQPEEPTVA